MKLFLHVGPHKTGTTLIQKTMLDNQAFLLQKGVFYPKQFMRIFGHHDFRNKLLEFNLTDEDIAFLEQANKNIVLSSEDFISLGQKHFQYLKERLNRFDIEVIYAWRRSSRKMFSIWQEIVKHGGTETFFEYNFQHVASPATSAMLSPDVKLRVFANVFGKNRIKIIDYDAAATDDNLLATFFNLVGINDISELKIPIEDKNANNKALSYYNSELLRAINYYFAKKKGIHGSAVRLAFTEHKESLDKAILNPLLDIIKSNSVEVNADKFFIDQRSERIMTENYADCMVNYRKNDLNNRFTVSKQDWLLDSNAFELFKALSSELSHFL